MFIIDNYYVVYVKPKNEQKKKKKQKTKSKAIHFISSGVNKILLYIHKLLNIHMLHDYYRLNKYIQKKNVLTLKSWMMSLKICFVTGDKNFL